MVLCPGASRGSTGSGSGLYPLHHGFENDPWKYIYKYKTNIKILEDRKITNNFQF